MKNTNVVDRDNQIVRRQIGREPRNMVGVSTRCKHGCPQVVITRPIGNVTGSAGVPELFPTMFWLSCPHLCRAIAALESEQWIDRFRSRVKEDSEFRRRLERRRRQYALERQQLISPEELRLFAGMYPHLYERLVEPGIGGIEHPGGVKCLHLHFADYLSGGDNPIGEEVHRLLESVGCTLECVDGGCCSGLRMVALVNVGSNSVKLLVARAADDADRPFGIDVVEKRVVVTCLAEGMRDSLAEAGHKCSLRVDAIERTVGAVDCLVRVAHSLGVALPLVFATAAVRRSDNRDDVASAIRDRTGLELTIITGREEAELSFEGVAAELTADADSASDSGLTLVLDIGGSSTEMALGVGCEMHESTSIDLGAVTVISMLSDHFDSEGRLSQPNLSDMIGCCKSAVRSHVDLLSHGRPDRVIAVGGSVAAAAALLKGLESYDRSAIHGTSLCRDEACGLLVDLCRRTRSERQAMQGMVDTRRADSVIGGIAILVALMEEVWIDGLTISENGVLEGMARRLLLRG